MNQPSRFRSLPDRLGAARTLALGAARRCVSRAASSFALAAAFALAPAASCAAAPPPPVQLVETRPVETTLGNPALPAAHDVWLEMIGGAKRTLDLEQFYCSTLAGEPLEDVLAAVGAAAKRGVRVRFLLDAGFYRTYPQPADSLGKLPGITVRRIHMGKIAGGVQHAKYFLVDGEQVFLGSQNFDWRALEHIHELGVRIRDPRVTAIFAEVFEADWAAAGEQMAGRDSTGAGARASFGRSHAAELPLRIAQAKGDTVNVWPSYTPRSFIPDTTLWDRDAIVRVLDRARSEIVVQLLTYSVSERERRDDAIDLALRRAASRGVRVRLLVSDWEPDNRRFADLQSLSEVANIEARLSTVPEWSQAYIPFARVEHCKYAVVDSQWTWVGTDNWEPGYFHGTRNLAVTLENRPIAMDARRIFETSWAAPTARVVKAGERVEPKVHGMTGPPGRPVHGR